MHLSTLTSSTGAPVSLTRAKTYLRNTSTDTEENNALRQQLRAAAEYCEGRVPGRFTLMRRTYRGLLPGFPSSRLELPRPPLNKSSASTSVDVQYVNSSGAVVTLSSTVYDVIAPAGRPAYLVPKYGESWPSPRDQDDAVRVTWRAGFGTTGDIPDVAKAAKACQPVPARYWPISDTGLKRPAPPICLPRTAANRMARQLPDRVGLAQVGSVIVLLITMHERRLS